jgi:vancomycin resistance protein YoaR
VLKSDATTALDEWSAKVTKDPLNARLGITDGKVTVLENDKNGTSVNKEKSLAAFTAAVQTGAHTATGVIQTAQAAVRADTIASLGLNELVGTATTDFSGSPNNRKFNIAKGAQALDRKLVKAGETFSTTGTLGPVEESTGYLPELVIKGNRTVPEAGGGLCQVSTTLFRSVLNAGLPIIERQNHAYRVSYYERDTGPGLDATVYIPNPDLKWKNDFGSAVFVQSTIVGTKITFDLYGTKDGRVSNIPKATILEVYPVGDAIYVNTDTLDKGVTKQIERAHDGAKTSVTYTVSRDGKEIYKKTFVSIYRAWPAQYLVGTHDPGTAQPTE